MNGYAIGLDIAITSIGWAVAALDENDRPYGIVNMGSRIFEAAENAQDGASLALPRREKRSMRRRVRRRRHRKERIKQLIANEKILSENELSHLFDGQIESIYEIRVIALDKLIDEKDFARLLIHFSQRRGFLSNRKGEKSKEDGKLLSAISENTERMKRNGYRTVGEMLLKDSAFALHKRNAGEEYITTVSRAMVEDEVKQIFDAQRKLGNTFASEDIEKKYLEILLAQRSFDEGPGEGSPYSGSMIEKMVGKCTFLPEEDRAAKATYSFEYFRLLQEINHIRIIKGGESRRLSESERRTVIELAHKSEIDFERIRKEIGLSEDEQFNNIRYDKDKPEKKKLGCLKAYHQMRIAIEKKQKGLFASLSVQMKNVIGETLTYYKSEEKIKTALKESGIDDVIADAVCDLNFTGFGHISAKACDRIIPYLEQGCNYNEACEKAGFDFKAHLGENKKMLLPANLECLGDITNPVVRRAVSQTIKVINAIIRKQGKSPTYVNIELAREMSKDFLERNQLKKSMEDNRSKNERIVSRLQEDFGIAHPTGQDIIKLKLFEEQNGMCMYSGQNIAAKRLFEKGYVEIDHIAPYSKSFDDGFKNKILVLSKENRDKGNRLPLEYMTGEKREQFIVRVNNFVRDYKKKRILLKEHFTEEDEKQFKERNLQDTKYISRFMMNYIRDNLDFAPFATDRKKHVTAVNGAVTAYMRKRWGITKVRADGDLHHAVDAAVIVCTSDSLIKKVSTYSKWKELEFVPGERETYAVDSETGEIIDRFPLPWEKFRLELEAFLSSNPHDTLQNLHLPLFEDEGLPLPERVFVSRMPRRKVSGAAHKETVKSLRDVGDGEALVLKKPLSALKLKNGEIEGYFNPGSDRLLYEALVERLKAFDNNAEKAFAEPFRKPKSDGTDGPVVKKVKIYEKSTLNVPVYGGNGVADNDSMVRTDVFYVEGDGYYLVPIYVADTVKQTLPNKACTRGKKYSDWKEMRDEDFVFSLYKNDLIKVSSNGEMKFSLNFKDSTLNETMVKKEEMVYYNTMSISTASIEVFSHDNAYTIHSLGVKTLKSIEKYTVDVLGEYHKIEKEKRMGF